MITKLKQSGRVRWPEGIGWLPAQVGQRRRGLQSVFQVEGEKIINIIINIGVLCRTPMAILLVDLSLRAFVWITLPHDVADLTKDIRYLSHQAYMGLHIFMTDAASRVLILMLFPGYSYSYSWCFQGTGEFINTRFFCRVCALMHNTQVYPHYHDLGQLVLILIIIVIIWMIFNHISPTLDTLLTYVYLDHVFKVTCMDVKFFFFKFSRSKAFNCFWEALNKSQRWWQS